jgi:hypothetical protein
VGRIQSTKSGVLNTVSPSQLRPPGTSNCQKVNAIGTSPSVRQIPLNPADCKHCFSAASSPLVD